MLAGFVHQTWKSNLPRPENLDLLFRTRTNAPGDVAVLALNESGETHDHVTDLDYTPTCVATFALDDIEELYAPMLGAWR